MKGWLKALSLASQRLQGVALPVVVGLNLLEVLASYLAARPVFQTAVFRMLPSQTIERICALERLSALG